MTTLLHHHPLIFTESHDDRSLSGQYPGTTFPGRATCAAPRSYHQRHGVWAIVTLTNGRSLSGFLRSTQLTGIDRIWIDGRVSIVRRDEVSSVEDCSEEQARRFQTAGYTSEICGPRGRSRVSA